MARRGCPGAARNPRLKLYSWATDRRTVDFINGGHLAGTFIRKEGDDLHGPGRRQSKGRNSVAPTHNVCLVDAPVWLTPSLHQHAWAA